MSLQEQPAVFPGYMWLNLHCGRCDYTWIGVAAVGTHGVRCPKCDLMDEEFVWLGPEPEGAHDGAWLTGKWNLPAFPNPGTVRQRGVTKMGTLSRLQQASAVLRAIWRSIRS